MPRKSSPRRPAKKAPKKRTPPRTAEPRGGLWHVSLCAGGNRWRRLRWVGSHDEADVLADHYRRRCKRAAVHREGQPPRERTAPVLPESYRPVGHARGRAERDPPSTDQLRALLGRFVSGDKDATLVLHDALIEAGFDWAALDLSESLRDGCRERRGLANRILSEVLNGSTVLEHGTWPWPPKPRYSAPSSQQQNPFVLILERQPVFFRGGTRFSSRKHAPRVVIWTRTGRGRTCRWRLWGTYAQADGFSAIDQAEKYARLDIADVRRRGG